MRFKLDENLPLHLSHTIVDAGHDAATVRGQGLSGCDDRLLYEVCQREERVLVTLDMDFANPLHFPPEATAGIVVLRPPRPLLSLMRTALVHALAQTKTEALTGRLWIVEPARLRIHESDSGDDADD